MAKSIHVWACVLFLLTCSPILQSAEEWGTLSGRFVYDGTAERPAALEVTRDKEVCGQKKLVDESLIVNVKNRGLQNVVVWLHTKKKVPVHASYPKLAKSVKLDNKDCRFTPRIVRLQTGQTLQSINSDGIPHNVAVYARRNQPFSVVIPEDKPLERTFDRGELLPIRVDCSIHAWMRAYLMITEHPYSAVSDKNGRFEIKNIPAGEWEFRFWHERPGYLEKLTVEQTHELQRGTLKLQIEGRGKDFGDIKLDAKDFAIDE